MTYVFNEKDPSPFLVEAFKISWPVHVPHSEILSTKTDIHIHLAKVWNTIYRQSIIWKSTQSYKIRRDFFRAVAMSILLHGCIT